MAKTLEGVKLGGSATPYVRAVEGALRAAGMWDDETWMLLGLTGLGFHLVADPGTCPSSPTSYDWTHVHAEAMRRVGVRSQSIECLNADGFDDARAEAVELARGALDRGVPCVFRGFEYSDFSILTGYDDAEKVFFVSDISADADPVLYANLGRPDGHPVLYVQVFDERNDIDLAQSAADSLRYAAACWDATAWSVDENYGYRVGAAAYKTIIEAVESGETDPLGLRYILRILADARADVAKYLRRLVDDDVLGNIAEQADLYAQAAERLGLVSELLPAEAPWERPLDRAVTPRAAELLREAADLEALAINRG